MPDFSEQKTWIASDSGGPSGRAFCVAKGKPEAIRASRGFARQKSHQFKHHFLCLFLLFIAGLLFFIGIHECFAFGWAKERGEKSDAPWNGAEQNFRRQTANGRQPNGEELILQRRNDYGRQPNGAEQILQRQTSSTVAKRRWKRSRR